MAGTPSKDTRPPVNSGVAVADRSIPRASSVVIRGRRGGGIARATRGGTGRPPSWVNLYFQAMEDKFIIQFCEERFGVSNKAPRRRRHLARRCPFVDPDVEERPAAEKRREG